MISAFNDGYLINIDEVNDIGYSNTTFFYEQYFNYASYMLLNWLESAKCYSKFIN